MNRTRIYKKHNFKPSGKSGRKRYLSKSSDFDINRYIQKIAEATEETTYSPMHKSFEEMKLPQALVGNLNKLGYETPTEIQDKVIPTLMAGQDVIGIAGTGTGKTAAFLLPVLARLLEAPREDSVLVLAPTRELANQVGREFMNLAKGLNCFCVTLIGGTSMRESSEALRRRNHVIIGTPGRVMDVVKRKWLSLDNVDTFILDEFDRMLDMGFIEPITEINDLMPKKAQTLLFSATKEAKQEKHIKNLTHDAMEIRSTRCQRIGEHVDQDVLHVSKGTSKLSAIHPLLTAHEQDRVIVFCEMKKQAEEISDAINKAGFRSDSIHGDKPQRKRESVLRKFKRGQSNILVATNVLARGIHVDDVSLVINYEPPQDYSDYVHRIGRTGRAGKMGKAITIIQK